VISKGSEGLAVLVTSVGARDAPVHLDKVKLEESRLPNSLASRVAEEYSIALSQYIERASRV
jgi:hypothetical protein